MIKRLFLFIFVAMVAMGSAMAKNNETLKCTLTLLDGKTVSGYIVDSKIKNEGSGTDKLYNLSEITIASTPEGDGVKYSANDSKKLVIKTKNGDAEFRSLYIMKNNTRPKNLKHVNNKCFLNIVYEKNGVYGFISDASEVFPTMSTGMNFIHFNETSTISYYYCVEGDEVVIPYWVPSSALSIGAKAGLRLSFERFPKVAEYIKSKEFSMKDFKKSPLDILDKFVELK